MTRSTLLPMVLSIASGACRPAAPPPAAPGHGGTAARPVPAAPDLVCEIRVEPFGPHDYLMRFGLSNHTGREKVLRYFYPFMDFKLRVTAGGRALRVVPDSYEGPVQPTVLHVPPHGRASLETPSGLAFAPEAQPRRSTWTILGEPPVDVTATMDIEGEVIAPCAASIPAPSLAP